MMMEAIQLPKEEKIAMGQENPSADVKKPSPSKARRKRAKKKSKQPPPLPPPPTKTHQQGHRKRPCTTLFQLIYSGEKRRAQRKPYDVVLLAHRSPPRRVASMVAVALSVVVNLHRKSCPTIVVV
ncbi:hypothetical protein Q3G72_024351 [Acer saccharum]|nr:hypothetical protein Q3G72_024351 [Acer saccharum]